MRVLQGLLVAAILAFGQAASAQHDEEESPYRPGLVAEYVADEGLVVRRIEAAIVHRGEGDLADPRLAPGGYKITWSGFIQPQADGRYRLHAAADGELTIRVAGRTVLTGSGRGESIELTFDWHPFEVEFRPAKGDARLSLYWEGPGFSLEPLDRRRLFHAAEKSVSHPLDRGRELVRALRCGACHELAGETAVMRAPALDKLAGHISQAWIAEWLSDDDAQNRCGESRRMPHFNLPEEEARAIAAWLAPIDADAATIADGDPAAGEKLLLATGCLACHKLSEFGQVGLFSGGDLSNVGAKRPASFFATWLKAPEMLNRRHRMPVFDLSESERRDLAAYLATLKGEESAAPAVDDSLRERGKLAFESRGCRACHEANEPLAEYRKVAISSDYRMEASCLAEADPTKKRPGYRLSEADRVAAIAYLDALLASTGEKKVAIDGQWLLVEKNCLGCHPRDGLPGLAPVVAPLAIDRPELASLAPAMTPPSLTSVGDKLHDEALRASIERSSAPHRPWLAVRMPRFKLPEEQVKALVDHLIASDRLPDAAATQLDEAALAHAGPRLVTQDGFGCTSCHAVGRVPPPKGPLAARGPDLSLLDKRIRRPWFDRWVRNPARIVPGMEMPSVQLPVRGVLDQNLDRQLAAVWSVLNTPGFEPPEPNPVRVVRQAGGDWEARGDRAIVLTDVLRAEGHTYIKPLLIALPNRHNVLWDLAENRLVGWWTGDAARQRTKGKSWYWEAGAASVAPVAEKADAGAVSDIVLIHDGKALSPIRRGQFLAETDSLEHSDQGVLISRRLLFENPEPQTVHIEDAIGALTKRGFARQIVAKGLAPGEALRFRPLGGLESKGAAMESKGVARIANVGAVAIDDNSSGELKLDAQGPWIDLVANDEGNASVQVKYSLDASADEFPANDFAFPSPASVPLHVVPGYEGVRLPLPDHLMPTSLCWRPDGKLVVTSLKGNVWFAGDGNGDGFEDSLKPFGDELAAPYGALAGDGYVDVVTKGALLRLHDFDGDDRCDKIETLASGWGHTDDYHDWAVGLVASPEGDYYIALPCQQDERGKAAAKWRGELLMFSPREPTRDDPHRFAIESISRGHRFPMGIARNVLGEIFVTDNQGNYNPFNELNFIVPGAHYGFINAIEKGKAPAQAIESPAIEIPHPWTRSVNGICFLETPPALKTELAAPRFGPFEGHLIGCEYDTRKLVRMSLDRVTSQSGEFVVQGAVYPFTTDKPVEGETLLGPVTCAVSPTGDLYIGCLRDSGWGGANNVGAISRFRPTPRLPSGIAEVRAKHDGFVIDFTQAVDRSKASAISSYTISSYRRTSTPAYGGEDQDRRIETIAGVEVSEDAKSVKLKLGEWRLGCVYEIHVANLSGDAIFHPAEAHYTLRTTPAL